MKTYTWRRGALTEGLDLREHERFGPSLVLGERGRGRWEEIIPLDRRSPPVVTNGRVVKATARTVELPARDGRSERKFVVLEAASSSASSLSVLVRVSTEWTYTRGSRGHVQILRGDVKVIAQGHGAHGDAGGIGSWEDVLLVVPPGGEVLIRPEGGYKTEPYRLWVDDNGRVDSAAECDRERMLAVGV